MRSIVQEIQSEFRRFIESRVENLLIVSCESEDSALLLKSLEALEDDPDSPDIFLIFGHPFTDSAEYVREIPTIIGRQVAHVNQELVKRGETILPPFPEVGEAESPAPSIRVANLM